MGQVTIGGNRLGSGSKLTTNLKNFSRSTHDLSYTWRSTMAAGTLVPFMTELALPGDTFDINLNCDGLTHPTIGPLFGSYKMQLDVFQVPIRLYQGKLHMNMLGIGMDMSKVPLPQMNLFGPALDKTQTLDNQHVNPSSIYSYLGVRGVGVNAQDNATWTFRLFNAIPYLGYWDIYKNYYANKQEEVGAVIHKTAVPPAVVITEANILRAVPEVPDLAVAPVTPTYVETRLLANSTLQILGTGMTSEVDPTNFILYVQLVLNDGEGETTMDTVIAATDVFRNWTIDAPSGQILGESPNLNAYERLRIGGIAYNTQAAQLSPNNQEPLIVTFPLKNVDDMRQTLLSHFEDTPYELNENTPAPYGLGLQSAQVAGGKYLVSALYSQEGLGLKTYQSDLFNNWISTEWIDGTDGISAVTAIDTSEGSFTIDELNLSKKIYDMLNRIAISGGSYDDWLDAVYTHERTRSAENPIYLGGLMQNLIFQEVVSNAQTEKQPLGTLAGRGKPGGKRKGGHIVAKVDEPSYLIGIISLTPKVDYSQGNKWDMNLRTMNDLHKPSLDEIGFQDLITDQMAWFDTTVNPTQKLPQYKSAGKQPAWINYMTNVDVVKGNFADQNQQMFMVLNRRYGQKFTGVAPNERSSISDLTTYIDPSKFNHIFADTRRDAQNFWVQIAVNIEARRKMSAKVIPNL